MPLTLTSLADEQLFEQYKAARIGVQQRIGNGVYPNTVAAIADYMALAARLGEGGDLAQFAEYYSGQLVETGIGPHIAQMLGMLMALKAKIEEIETGYPGTFSIQIPGMEAEDEPV